MNKRILSMTAAIAALGTTTAAFAGNADVAVVEPAPVAPIVVETAAPVGNWNGAYGGLSFGAMKGQTGAADDSSAVYGVFGGYDYQFGRGIIGGEIEYSGNDDLSVGNVDVDNISRVKVRGGYDLGSTMIYATAGMSKVETSFGDATAPVGGFGAEYQVNDRFGIGGEYLIENFENLGSTNTDLRTDSLSLRGTLRF